MMIEKITKQIVVSALLTWALLLLVVGGTTSIADSAAAPVKTKYGISFIQQTIKKYSSETLVQAKIKKEVHLELLGETRLSEGNVSFASGRVRLEIEKPEKNLLIMAKDAIWLVQPADKDLGNKTQVTKIRSKELKKQSRAPLAIILTDAKAWNKFKVMSESVQGDSILIHLRPKDEKALGEVVDLNLKISKNTQEIKELSYSDEMDNRTRYLFSETAFGGKVIHSRFDYVPGKDAEVTVLE